MKEKTMFCGVCERNTKHKYAVEYNFGDPALGVKDEGFVCTESHILNTNLEQFQDHAEQNLALGKKLSKWG